MGQLQGQGQQAWDPVLEATPGQIVAYSLELPAIPLPVHSKFQQAWWITSCLWERTLVEGRHKKSTLLFPVSERSLARQGSILGFTGSRGLRTLSAVVLSLVTSYVSPPL